MKKENLQKKYFYHVICSFLGWITFFSFTFLRCYSFGRDDLNWYLLASVAILLSCSVRSSLKNEKRLFRSFLFYGIEGFLFIVGLFGVLWAIFHFYFVSGGELTTYNLWNLFALIYAILLFLFDFITLFVSRIALMGKACYIPIIAFTIFESIFYVIHNSGVFDIIICIIQLFCVISFFSRRNTLSSYNFFFFNGIILFLCSILTWNLSGICLGITECREWNHFGINKL